MSRSRPNTRKPPRKCSICRRRPRDRYGVCVPCERSFFEVGLDSEIPRLLNRAKEIQREHRISVEYAVRVATGHYSLEVAKRQDQLKKQAQSDLSKRVTEIAKKHGIGIGYAQNVVMGRYSLAVAKKKDRLKKRERDGTSVDAFSLGRRQPGCFGSKQ
jgi:hypothetical protein